MKTTSQLLCFLCFVLVFTCGCGSKRGTSTLSPTEQAQVDIYLRDNGKNAIRILLASSSQNTDKELVLKYVKYLASHGAEVNGDFSTTRTPLHYAALCGYVEVAEYLVSQGADANARNPRDKNKTILHYVVQIGGEKGVQAVKLLISVGADVNARDDDGVTPLDETQVNVEIAEYLKSVGAKSGK